MTALLIGNSRTEEMAGDLTVQDARDQELAACTAHRMLWWARDGDILVLPTTPGDDYADYVTGLTGTLRSTLTVLVPRTGRLGTGVLSPDRLADPDLRGRLRAALAGQAVDRVLPVCAGLAVTGLARRLGVEAALPGHGFHAQGGAALVNSKAVFRAIATGTGTPIAPGTVAGTAEETAEAIKDLLDQGHCAMVKREFAAGGLGNDILSPKPGIRPVGARRVLVPTGPPDVEEYVAGHPHQGHRLVVERYFPDSVPVYAEFEIGDEAITLSGTGEMLMDPTAVGEIVPALVLPPETRRRLVREARRLCTAYRAMGYRGTMSPDACLTPDGELFFTEVNGRLTGSTHLHTAIGARLVGEARRPERVLLENGALPAPSFRAAVDRLAAAGLAFDPATRTGTVLTGDHTTANGTVVPCVIAEDLGSARHIERTLTELFPGARS